MSNKIRYLFTLAVPVAGLALAGAWALNLGAFGKKGLVYETAEVTRGEIRKIVSTSGPVRALVTVSIGSELSGKVRDVSADFNTEVKAGQALAVLDPKTFESRVAQTKADLAAAQAQVLNQQAAKLKAEATLKQAELNVERQKTLASRGISAQAALETATRDVEIARADVAVAEAQIENAKATVSQRQAVLDQAQIDLTRTRIISPIDGTVISRTVDPGQTVAASLQAPELFKIAQDLRRIRIEAQVNEADVGTVAEGNTVSFSVDAYPERKFEGVVKQVRLAATELNNVVTYTVIIEAANQDRRLFPGMTANVEIESAKKDGALRVPNDALRYRPREEVASRGASSPFGGPPGGAFRKRGGDSGERTGGGGRFVDRQIERVKEAVKLSEPQVAAARAALQGVADGRRPSAAPEAAPSAGRGQAGGGGMRQQMSAKIEQALAPLLTDDQKPLFEAWKLESQGSSRRAPVWVLGAEGIPERRMVRLGMADEQFTEVASGELSEGEHVVLRAREVK